MFIITRDGRKSRKNIHQEGEEMRSGFYGFLTDDVHAPHFSLSAYAIPCVPGKRRGQTKVFPLLLILLLFLAAVRRFLSESDTDIGLLPGYDGVDVCLLCTVGKWGGCRRFGALAPHPSRLRCSLPKKVILSDDLFPLAYALGASLSSVTLPSAALASSAAFLAAAA